jgi:hypothetical protein
MNPASWFRPSVLKSLLTPRNRRPDPSSRRPSRPGLLLERLEDRTVPNVAAFSLGAINNPTGPSFNLPQSGFVVVNPTFQSQSNGQQNTVAIFGAGQGNANASLVGAAAVNAFGRDPNSFSSLFPASSINSLGLGQVGLPGNLTPTFGAFGFGSGTQPGAPWAPAAYNLGLANQQAGYPSISDHGYQATPPWAIRNIAYHHPNNKGQTANDTDGVQRTQPLGPVVEELEDDIAPWDAGPDDEDDGAVLPEPYGAIPTLPATLTRGHPEDRQDIPVRADADPTFSDAVGTVPGVRRGEPEVEALLFAGHPSDGQTDASRGESVDSAQLTLSENLWLDTSAGRSGEWTTVRERLTESPLLLGATLGLVWLPTHSPVGERSDGHEEGDRRRPE